MKKADIYEIAVKILGLYLVIPLINILQQLVGSILVWLFQKNDFPAMASFANYLNLFLQLGYCALYVWFIYTLIFKTKWLVRKICKDSDYEEDSKLFADKKTVFEIALIIIGGVVFIQTLPDLGGQIYSLVVQTQNNFNPSFKGRDFRFLITEIIKLVIAILIVLDAKPLAAYFTREKKAQN